MATIREDLSDIKSDVQYVKKVLELWEKRSESFANVKDVELVSERVNKIESNISRLIMGMLTAVITAVVSLVIKKP